MFPEPRSVFCPAPARRFVDRGVGVSTGTEYPLNARVAQVEVSARLALGILAAGQDFLAVLGVNHRFVNL